MCMRAGTLVLLAISVVLSGCGDGGKKSGFPSAVPGMPAVPAMELGKSIDPQEAFNQWKDIVTHPEKAKNSVEYGQLAVAALSTGPEMGEKMIDLLVDPATKPESRFLILNSLELAVSPALYPRLLGLTKPETDPSIRAGVVLMLKSADDPAVNERLRELIKDPERRVRLAAMIVLSEKGDKEVRSSLQEYYFTDGLPPEHRGRIAKSLAQAPETGDLKVFIAAVNDAALPEESRLITTGALGRLGDPAGIPSLQQCASGNNSAELKDYATRALKVLQEKAGQTPAPKPQ